MHALTIFRTSTAALLVAATLTGCSVRDIYAGIYETLRFQNERETLPQERSFADPAPDFNRYEAERRRLLGAPPPEPGSL